MVEADHDFYSRRMSEELDRAEAAQSSDLRKLHYRWADEYRRRLDKLGVARGAEPLYSKEDLRMRRQSGAFGDWLADVL